MAKSRGLQEILDQAKEKEKAYDWLEAAEFYGQALGLVAEEDVSRRGEIQEYIGYCLYRGAFQAETQGDFKRLIGLSAEAYERAAGVFEELVGPEKQARTSLCRAKAAYSRSWLAGNPTGRTAALDESWKLGKEAAEACEEAGDQLGFGKVGSELLMYLRERSLLAHEWQELKNILEEALKYGERAIQALSEAGDTRELARAYFMLGVHYIIASSVYESIEEQKNLRQKALTYARKALEVVETTGDAYLIGMANVLLGTILVDSVDDFKSSRKYLENALELGMKAKDKLLTALALDNLAFFMHWHAQMVEDPGKRQEQYSKTIQFAKDAIAHFELLSYPTIWSYYRHPSSYVALAREETDLEKKRTLLKKAVEIAEKYLPKAKRLGSPDSVVGVLHPLSAALYSLAVIETETRQKRRLLEKAAEYKEEAINMYARLYPFDYWDRGMLNTMHAAIKADLAKIETDGQERRDLLTEAALTMEESLKFIKTALKERETAARNSHIASTQETFADILNRLYELTREKTYLKKAIKTYEDAVETREKIDQQSRIAEAHWQIARLYDQLGEHLNAAQEFQSASEGYTRAAEKLPQLKTFYTDHTTYMRAWSEIEQARHHHAKRQYGKAKEYYENAANLHESTARWSYLSPNYSAWARLEEAEDLSRREQAEEARDLFQKAANLFVEAEKSAKAKLETIEASDEKEMAAELAKASDTRCEYCQGRIALEEAKILDRQGDHTASSEKYGSAAETFHKMAEAESEQSRRELQPIIYLCQAWQKMMMAEAKASSTMYGEAAELFQQAKEHALDQPTSLLALAHSSFCKALEAGTEFEITRDMTIYSTAVKHMEAAANYYLKAGFKTASEYARGTHRLFDAYMYTHKAETETEPRKKAQYYKMTERLLQTSAGSYMKAKHPEKSEEVGRLLERVREEQELAMSLSEVLHAPAIASTTTSFSTPTPTHEQAAGLERFEHADIQANLILRVREVRVGEDISLAIEVVNAGKAPALLIKVDEVIPEGFEIKEVPEMYTFEDSYINMKGKRLNPLKTEDVKVVVNPRSKGTHIIKPRILYIDETGKYKSHEPEPVTITVKELGIGGWIKGEK